MLHLLAASQRAVASNRLEKCSIVHGVVGQRLDSGVVTCPKQVKKVMVKVRKEMLINMGRITIVGRQSEITRLTPIFGGLTVTMRFYRKRNKGIGWGFG